MVLRTGAAFSAEEPRKDKPVRRSPFIGAEGTLGITPLHLKLFPSRLISDRAFAGIDSPRHAPQLLNVSAPRRGSANLLRTIRIVEMTVKHGRRCNPSEFGCPWFCSSSSPRPHQNLTEPLTSELKTPHRHHQDATLPPAQAQARELRESAGGQRRHGASIARCLGSASAIPELIERGAAPRPIGSRGRCVHGHAATAILLLI